MDEIEKKYLCAIGFRIPENQEEELIFDQVQKNFDYQIKSDDIDPFGILKRIKEDDTKEVSKNNANKQNISKAKNYFTRAVLAAEIVNSCYQERTFGSVKFQKLVYLCENVSKMNLTVNYMKQAAGPFDRKFMHTIKDTFKKQKWFEVRKEKVGNFEKVNFYPLENSSGYKKYYEKYFAESDESIQFLISNFKTSKSNWVELVATIFYCISEMSSKKQLINSKSLLHTFYSFHPRKEKFSSEEILRCNDWMKKEGIYPV